MAYGQEGVCISNVNTIPAPDSEFGNVEAAIVACVA
jgi:hypothetical protein